MTITKPIDLLHELSGILPTYMVDKLEAAGYCEQEIEFEILNFTPGRAAKITADPYYSHPSEPMEFDVVQSRNYVNLVTAKVNEIVGGFTSVEQDLAVSKAVAMAILKLQKEDFGEEVAAEFAARREYEEEARADYQNDR